MPIITLTTDWNSEDYYIGVFKGKLLSRSALASIVDISHKISPFNTLQAAFVLRNSFLHFPEGTIHVIFVNAEPSETTPFLIVKSKGHYFIGADNGIFDLTLIDDPEMIVRLDLPVDYKLSSFCAFDVFAKAAVDIAQGVEIETMGEKLGSYNRRTPLRATIEDKTITGSVIYIDSYMNAITNITRDLFLRVGDGRKFEIYVQSKHYKITSINEFYHQSPVGELLAIFNSSGLLEIAINKGTVAPLLNLEINSVVRVEFNPSKIK